MIKKLEAEKASGTQAFSVRLKADLTVHSSLLSNSNSFFFFCLFVCFGLSTQDGKAQEAIDAFTRALSLDPLNDAYNSALYCNRYVIQYSDHVGIDNKYSMNALSQMATVLPHT